MDSVYAAHYAELYHGHWWWRVREAAILAELRRLRPPTGWRRILDVGCGDGLFFDRLAEFGEVEGVEPDMALLDPAGPWRRAIHAVPFDESFQPASRFDLILMLDVLEHLEHPEAALHHAVSLLTRCGVVVITVPALQWLWTRHDDLNHHVMRYDRRSIRRLAKAAGFRILRQRYLFQWLVPVKLAVRVLEAIRPARRQLPGIPPEPINRLLAAITRLESVVALRIPLPLGNSLLVSGTATDFASKRAGDV